MPLKNTRFFSQGSVICTDPNANSYNAQYQGGDYGAYDGYYGVSELWSPGLIDMFVVNVVDGRLGQFNLSPVVVFPGSPKYITPESPVPRSGAFGTVGADGWLVKDEVREYVVIYFIVSS